MKISRKGLGLGLTIGGSGLSTVSTTPIATVAGTPTKDGSGTLTITVANTYTGLTTISAGVLNAQNATALGTTAARVRIRQSDTEHGGHDTGAFGSTGTVVAGLAKRYSNSSVGDIVVTAEGPTCTFHFGGWKSPVATRKNDDGTVSVVTTAPGGDGVPFVVGNRDGKRVLVLRDMQHEYVFTEAN